MNPVNNKKSTTLAKYIKLFQSLVWGIIQSHFPGNICDASYVFELDTHWVRAEQIIILFFCINSGLNDCVRGLNLV